jgi:hypothetical protein
MCGQYSAGGNIKCGMNICCSGNGWCGTTENHALRRLMTHKMAASQHSDHARSSSLGLVAPHPGLLLDVRSATIKPPT